MLCQLSAALLTSAALGSYPGSNAAAFSAGPPHVVNATAAQTPEPCVCSANFALVTLSLRDTNGAPIQDAAVSVRRVSTHTERVAAADLPGVYIIADDMLRDSVRASGEPFEVTVRWRSRTQRVVVQVGTQEPPTRSATGKPATPLSACRCHVRRIAGPDRLTLP